VHPENRLALALVVSLALWGTTLRLWIAGETSLGVLCLRYVVAFGLAWLAVTGLDRLVRSYAGGGGSGGAAGERRATDTPTVPAVPGGPVDPAGLLDPPAPDGGPPPSLLAPAGDPGD
jgi:hypothetical protein